MSQEERARAEKQTLAAALEALTIHRILWELVHDEPDVTKNDMLNTVLGRAQQLEERYVTEQKRKTND